MAFEHEAAPLGTGSCEVVATADGWELLYTRFLAWDEVDGSFQHRYEVHRALLDADGRVAVLRGVAIGLEAGEHSLCHPTVLDLGGVFLGAFCVRGDRYRIHLAVAGPDLRFQRIGEVGGLSHVPGAAEEQCYPRLIRDGRRIVLVYSGDRYGRDALMAAVWSGGSIEDLVVSSLSW